MDISDGPITRVEDDELGRVIFANKLADKILELDPSECKVVGVYGSWGHGKTSILNLAVARIRALTDGGPKVQKPLIIHFNPWNYSQQEGLLLAFLQEVFSALDDRLPTNQKDFQDDINELARILGVFESVPVVGWMFSTTRKAINKIVPETTLEEVRAKIDVFFKGLRFKTLIIIDDLDRLTADEIRLMFQLVKTNANFPNTVYLLAFDRKVAEQALSPIQGGNSGRVYLEKIVQIAFDIPAVEGSRLEDFLQNRLKQVLLGIPDKDWDRERWIELYHSGFRNLFGSVRDVKRFLNSLSFTLGTVIGEVNPLDFVVLEGLRVLLPETYYAIASNKNLFTAIEYRELPDERRARTEALEKVFSEAGDQRQTGLSKQLCMGLFPAIRRYFGGGSFATNAQERWRQDRRICSPEVFDTYFILGVPKGEIAQGEIAAIIQSAGDQNRFAVRLDQLVADGRLTRFLNLAQDRIDLLNVQDVPGFAERMILLGEKLETVAPEAVFQDGNFRIARLIYLALSRLEAYGRCRQFELLVERVGILYQVVFVLALDGRAADGARRQKPLFADACLDALQQHCARLLAQSAKDGKLLASQHLAYKLFRWRDWAGSDAPVRAFVSDSIASGDGLLAIVRGFVMPVQVSMGRGLEIEWQVNMKNVAELIDPQDILNRLDALGDAQVNALGEDDVRAIKAFRGSHAHWLKVNKADDFPYRALDYLSTGSTP